MFLLCKRSRADHSVFCHREQLNMKHCSLGIKPHINSSSVPRGQTESEHRRDGTFKTEEEEMRRGLTSAALTCDGKLQQSSSGFLFCWTRRFMFRVCSSENNRDKLLQSLFKLSKYVQGLHFQGTGPLSSLLNCYEVYRIHLYPQQSINRFL